MNSYVINVAGYVRESPFSAILSVMLAMRSAAGFLSPDLLQLKGLSEKPFKNRHPNGRVR